MEKVIPRRAASGPSPPPAGSRFSVRRPRDRPRFDDRVDAGRRLAPLVAHLKDADVVVLGLPRGGVPVAAEVAAFLGAPLDVLVVRKLGVPWRPELAMGAIGEGGVRVVERSVVDALRLTEDDIRRVEAVEQLELERRVAAYRGDRPMTSLRGRVALIVDDGIATGSTAEAACAVARAHGASQVVVAIPVAAAASARRIANSPCSDEVVCLATPTDFRAIGAFYRDFSPTSDEEVEEILGRAVADPAPVGPVTHSIEIGLPDATLPGTLVIPPGATSVVVFAHGSGSSRLSPRNQQVATHLVRAGHATLLFDLLTDAEAGDRRLAFDIPLLATRLRGATEWLAGLPTTAGHRIGYFGASTGAAAALVAAADLGHGVGAVVSRGGRPDLAGPALGRVSAPTLLIVGSRDQAVLDLNHDAAAHLRCPHELAVVDGATHLFEEPGTLGRVAALATEWFDRHLG